MPTGVGSLIKRLEANVASNCQRMRSSPMVRGREETQSTQSATTSPISVVSGIRAKGEGPEQYSFSQDVVQERHVHALLGFGHQRSKTATLKQRRSGESSKHQRDVVPDVAPSINTREEVPARDLDPASGELPNPDAKAQLLCESCSRARSRLLTRSKGKAPLRRISARSQVAEEFYRSSLRSESGSIISLTSETGTLSLYAQLDSLFQFATPSEQSSDHMTPLPAQEDKSPLACYIPSGADSARQRTTAPKRQRYPSLAGTSGSDNSSRSAINTNASSDLESYPSSNGAPVHSRPTTAFSDYSFNRPPTTTPFYTPYATHSCQFCSQDVDIRRISGSTIESLQRPQRCVEEASLGGDIDDSIIVADRSLIDVDERYLPSAWGLPVEYLYEPVEQVIVETERAAPRAHQRCKWWKRVFCTQCRRRGGNGASQATGSFDLNDAVQEGTFEVLRGERTVLEDYGIGLRNGDGTTRCWWRSSLDVGSRNRLLKRSPPRAVRESVTSVSGQDTRSSMRYLSPRGGSEIL